MVDHHIDPVDIGGRALDTSQVLLKRCQDGPSPALPDKFEGRRALAHAYRRHEDLMSIGGEENGEDTTTLP